MNDVVNRPEMIRLAEAREMQCYNTPTRAMYVGAPGKVGYLNLSFELDGNGKSVMRRHERMAPLIVQKELYCDEGMPAMPVVYILSAGGPNVDGDRYLQRFTVQSGAFAHITTGAATKIAEMNDNFSALHQQIDLAEGCYLELMPEPTIPCRASRFISRSDIVCHPSATLFYSEIFACGRKHSVPAEIFDYDIISVTCSARRPGGSRLFREKFLVEPKKRHPAGLGILGKYHIFANVIVLTPPDKIASIYDATEVGFNQDTELATGITRLPNEAGLLLKIVGMETEPVKRAVREFASTVRMVVKGCPMLPDFPWR
jgi:urease accessory protein